MTDATATNPEMEFYELARKSTTGRLKLKKWGRALPVVQQPTLLVELVQGKAGGASSMHQHKRMHNTFICRSGRMQVNHEPLNGTTTRTVLRAGESLTIPAGIWHRMIFLEDSQAVEVYTPASGAAVIDPDDITRRDEGWEPGQGPKSGC